MTAQKRPLSSCMLSVFHLGVDTQMMELPRPFMSARIVYSSRIMKLSCKFLGLWWAFLSVLNWMGTPRVVYGCGIGRREDVFK